MKQTKNNKLSHGVKKTVITSVIALSLYGANSFAGFENYSFKSYGTPFTSYFWKHNYLGAGTYTHTGQDFDVGDNKSHVSIYSHGFGKITNINNTYNAPTIRHMLDNGHYVYLNLLHFHKINSNIVTGNYAVSNQLLGTEGNKGLQNQNKQNYNALGDYDTSAHLHVEVSNMDTSDWVSTKLACLGDGCTDITRTKNFDFDDFIAHYRIQSVKQRNIPYRNRVWYSPYVFVAHTEALPYISQSSTSPSFENYDVFGIADQSIYGHLNLKGTFQESGILVRNLFQRKSAESALKLNDVNPRNNDRFLGADNHANQEIPAEGISENSVYAMGDYLFLAYVKSGDKNRFGYPVKFTFVPEGSVIIDNDQKNAGEVSKVVKTEPAYTYAGKQGEKVPGYFLTAELHNGRSGDSVRWTPNKAGKYKIFVHIPEYGATATEVYYSIKDGSTSILSKPVNQNNNKDKWVQIFDKDGLEDFEFTKDGYLALALDSAASTNLTNQNYLKIDKAQKVAFDAVKFVCEAPCLEPQAVPNITAAEISKTSIQLGENVTFSAVLDKPLEGYSVRVKYGSDLLRMEPDYSAQNFSLTVTPSTAGNYPYSIGIYDDKDILQGKEFSGESFTVTENVASGDYTKIANDGSKLADSANLGANPKDWACTRDNKTGLIWEVKTTDGGLRDMNNYYSWYEPDASKNGGFAGYPNYGSCKGSECDTYAYTNAVNTQGLCGAKDWRMPNNEELKGLIYCSDNQTKTLGKEEYGLICTGSPSRPTINTTYFPDIKDNYWFWSSSPGAVNSSGAWVVHFGYGDSSNYSKSYSYNVRLVR